VSIRGLALACTAVLTLAGTLVAPSGAGATTAGSPVGHLDSVTLVSGNLVVSGWSLDRDHLSSESVDVYQTAPVRAFRGRVTTSILRGDVNRALHVTGSHGWSFATPATTGAQTWCAYGLNVGAGANTNLGCLTVTVPAGHAPQGGVSSVTSTDTALTISGYAFDPDDRAHPESVDVYEMTPVHRFVSRISTMVDRPDINSKYHLTGTHGFSVDEPEVVGSLVRYCFYALNVGVRGPNSQVGCASWQSPGAPGAVTGMSIVPTATSAALTFSVVPASQYPKAWIIRRPAEDEGSPLVVGTRVADLAVGNGQTLTYTDPALVPGVAYAYFVALHNDTGNLDVSPAFPVTTTRAPCAASVCSWGTGGLSAGPASPHASLIPVPTVGADGVTKVVAGYGGGSALKSDGTVLVWGNQMPLATPSVLPGLSGIVDIANATSAGYAVKADGTLWTWGTDYSKRDGTGNHPFDPTPRQVPGVTGITSVVAGEATAYALASDGTVWATGSDTDYALGGVVVGYVNHIRGLTGIASLGAAGYTGFAVTSDGAVWAWGDNHAGTAGTGSASDALIAPVTIPGLTGVASLSSGGAQHVLALMADGTVEGWGSGAEGELGNGTSGSADIFRSPIIIDGLTGVLAVAAGELSSFALMSDHTVSAWGIGSELGIGSSQVTTIPTPVYGLTNVRQLSAHRETVFAIRSSG